MFNKTNETQRSGYQYLSINGKQDKGKYTIEDIAYNFLQCYNNGLIDAKINYQSSNLIQSTTSDIYGITFRGIDFMNQD